MNKMKRISLFFIMVICLFPATVFADEIEQTPEEPIISEVEETLDETIDETVPETEEITSDDGWTDISVPEETPEEVSEEISKEPEETSTALNVARGRINSSKGGRVDLADLNIPATEENNLLIGIKPAETITIYTKDGIITHAIIETEKRTEKASAKPAVQQEAVTEQAEVSEEIIEEASPKVAISSSEKESETPKKQSGTDFTDVIVGILVVIKTMLKLM